MIPTRSTVSPGPRSEALFTAQTAEQALALVKRALGPDALVVSSRAVGDGASACFQVHATSAAGGLAPRVSQLELGRAERHAAFGFAEMPTAKAPPTVGVLERILREHDVPAAIARALVLRSEAHLPGGSMPDRIVGFLRAAIGFGEASLASSRVVALVGPTGVGKTTTIAKLATIGALVHGRRIGLVSLDDHRVGGAEQLARYAELIGAPFEVATDAASLAAAIARMPDADRIYVDTAGRAPREKSAHAELLDRLTGAGPALGMVLCVAAASRSSELEAILGAHLDASTTASGRRAPRPKALAVTKLDEAILVGAAITAAARTELPIAWLTTGQRVPEDVEIASAERFARALVEGDR